MVEIACSPSHTRCPFPTCIYDMMASLCLVPSCYSGKISVVFRENKVVDSPSGVDVSSEPFGFELEPIVERFLSCIYLVVGVCIATMSQLMRNAQGFDHYYNAPYGGDTKG